MDIPNRPRASLVLLLLLAACASGGRSSREGQWLATGWVFRDPTQESRTVSWLTEEIVSIEATVNSPHDDDLIWVRVRSREGRTRGWMLERDLVRADPVARGVPVRK